MTYTVTKLGTWAPYTPEAIPDTIPEGTLFLRRAQDGADWYDIAHNAATPVPGRVFITCLPVPEGYLTQAIHSEIARLFPVNCLLLQVDGVDPAEPKPWQLFEKHYFNPTTREFSPVPTPEKHSLSKSEFWARCTDQEAEILDGDLEEAPARLRQAYNAATRLDDRSPFWSDLEAAITNRVGPTRAAELLARTE